MIDDLSTVVGYTAQWFTENNNVHMELELLGGERKSLGNMAFEQATVLVTMLNKNGKKSVCYKDGQYLQVSEYYKYK